MKIRNNEIFKQFIVLIKNLILRKSGERDKQNSKFAKTI